MKTLVVQSYKTVEVPQWIESCLASVKEWSASKAYDYRFVGDEIFELVPAWYKLKVAEKLPVATDYARLILLQQALDVDNYDQVIWFDADTLIFDQSLELSFSGSCAFGQELWIQRDGTKYRATKNVHNALCVFNAGCPVLPFLIQTVASIIERVVADKISPQMVGPKLLTALHNIAGFSLVPQVGALSPELLADIAVGEGEALDFYKKRSQVSGFTLMQAANLCASIVDTDTAERCVEVLLKKGLV